MLFSTVAAGALCVVAHPAKAGPDACTIAANVATCSGNQSGGIDAGLDFNAPPVTTLNVNNLTQDIGPNASGGDGIRWSLPGPQPTSINIISNTGSFSIRASGNGMNVHTAGGIPVNVNHTGNIFAGNFGILAGSVGFNGGPTVAGTVSVSMIGNIVSDDDGISAFSTMQSGDGDASAVTVNFTGNITTNNNNPAISATSQVQQGNGNSGNVTVESNGNFNGNIGARSSVFGNGNSGIVDVSHQGQSGGITSESLVGGNGNSGAAIVSNTGNISNGRIWAASIVDGIGDAAAVSITNAGNISGGFAASISAISQAKTDGDAGSVTVTSTGNLAGIGTGISALSQAAGNGDAGGVVISNTGNIAAAAGISATSRATTGDANLVTVTNIGNITASNQFGISAISFTLGGNTGPVGVQSTGNISASAHGITAQSITNFGSAGAAVVLNNGNINAGTVGILALSVADAVGSAADVTVTSTGNISAGNRAIEARSLGAAGHGNINVAIGNGVVMGGSGAGVEMSGGVTNLLTVGPGATLSSLSGFAIVSDTGDDAIRNSGIVTGNVLLGTGTNSFSNFAGALFNAGSTVDLGGGLLNNMGAFAPGGVGTPPITTTLTGNFVQGVGASLAVDVGNGTADRVNVSGTATLLGRVKAMVSSLTSLTQQFTILSAAGGTTNNGITVQDTLLFDYELLFPNANDMVLAVTANFTPTGVALTPNQRVTAAHLQSGLIAGGGNLGSLINYLGGLANGASYAAALDRLHPEPYLAPVQSALLANLGFTDGLMSCPTLAQSDANTFIAEGQCAWARMGARQLDVDRTAENTGYRDKAWGGSAGVQFALAPNWFGSIALGYDRSDIKVDDRASATGDLLHMGAGAKYIHGNWQISGALAGGHASYDVTRFGVMPGMNAKGDMSLNFLSGRLRTAYVFGSDNAYVKPMVDIDAIGIWRGGITESGAGAAGLNVRAQTDTLFSVAPAVEVGGQFVYANNSVLRPFLRAGVRVFSEDDLKATAAFIGSPAAAPDFTVTTPLDQWMGEVSTGLEMLSNDRYDARISYESRFGERTTQHGGSVKLRAKL